MLYRFSRLVTLLAFTATLCSVVFLYIFYFYGRGLPEYTYLRHYEPPMMSRLYSADAQLVHEYAIEKRLFVPFSLIPQPLKEAFLAAEDKNFFYHFGIDILGTLRALIVNTVSGSWQRHPGGASSITQQVAKNFLTGNERSMSRKIKEAIMALRLEYSLPKERIFELYLNQIYLGAGTYGVAAAALVYFDKELTDLDLEEIAFIAALPKAPSTLTNKDDQTKMRARRNWVIDRMVEEGFTSPTAATAAKMKPLTFRKYRELPIKADYFADAVRREISDKLGRHQLETGGLSVRTTLDPALQRISDQALRQGLITYDRRHGWRGPLSHLNTEDLEDWETALAAISRPEGLGKWQLAIVLEATKSCFEIGLSEGKIADLQISDEWDIPTIYANLKVGDVIVVSHEGDDCYELQQIPEVSGAIVIMAPETGRVLAISGGFDYAINQFNCATMAKRQPGSVFKPFAYLAALEKGYTPTTKILDAPISISLGRNRGYYCPKNYSKRYYGLCNLRVGLEQSRNVMTIRLAQHIGMNSIISVARDFGVHPNLPKQLAMVLGAAESTVLNMTAAYAMIANGGKKIIPYLIDSVQDRYGDTLLKAPKQDHQQLASPQAITHITDMLAGVITRGTAKRLQSLGFEVAGKTGTTNDCRDAWFIGFSKDLVVGVFVGYLTPKSLGEKETGGRVATPIFETIMRQIYANHQKPAPLIMPTVTPFEEAIEIIDETTHVEVAESALQLALDPVSMKQD